MDLSVGAEGGGAARIQIDEQRSLRLIPAYKHPGAFLESTGALQWEITKRCTSGKVVASNLARQVFDRKKIPWKQRAVARACLGSFVLSRAVAWRGLANGQWKQVEVELMRPLRCIQGAQQAAAALGEHVPKLRSRTSLAHPK